MENLPHTLAEFEAGAAERLEPDRHGYFAGGTAAEMTLRANVEAWQRILLRPRVLVDVSVRDLSTTVLGVRRPHPLVVAPTAFHRLAHPEAEPAAARGAAATGTPFCLSTLANTAPAELGDGTRWFQLYVFKDRGLTSALIEAAERHGYEALVLTVDLPVFGRRDRDLRSGFTVDAPIPSLGGEEGIALDEVGEQLDASLTWPDLELLVDATNLPVLVKGVLTPEDARRAVAAGAAGVVVSNHGGRQLDTVAATAVALPQVVEEVGEDADVLVDGGIRRGTDVVKALALGARAVLIGRPVVWGLAVGGADGVQRVLEILLAELDTALALAGTPAVADLDGEVLDVPAR